jgi:hypothetical protein
MRITGCCPFSSFSRLLSCRAQSTHQRNAKIRMKELNSSNNKNNHPEHGQFLNAQLSRNQETLILFFSKDGTQTQMERYVDNLGVFHEEAPSQQSHSVNKRFLQPMRVEDLIGENEHTGSTYIEHTGSTRASRNDSKPSVLLLEGSTSIELPAIIPPLENSASLEEIIQI